jgi:hypothetical protein
MTRTVSCSSGWWPKVSGASKGTGHLASADILDSHRDHLGSVVATSLLRVGELDGPVNVRNTGGFYSEAQELLARTTKLPSRTGLVFARGRQVRSRRRW